MAKVVILDFFGVITYSRDSEDYRHLSDEQILSKIRAPRYLSQIIKALLAEDIKIYIVDNNCCTSHIKKALSLLTDKPLASKISIYPSAEHTNPSKLRYVADLITKIHQKDQIFYIDDAITFDSFSAIINRSLDNNITQDLPEHITNRIKVHHLDTETNLPIEVCITLLEQLNQYLDHPVPLEINFKQSDELTELCTSIDAIKQSILKRLKSENNSFNRQELTSYGQAIEALLVCLSGENSFAFTAQHIQTIVKNESVASILAKTITNNPDSELSTNLKNLFGSFKFSAAFFDFDETLYQYHLELAPNQTISSAELFENLRAPYHIRAVMKILLLRDIHIIVFTTNENVSAIRQALNLLMGQKTDGVITIYSSGFETTLNDKALTKVYYAQNILMNTLILGGELGTIGVIEDDANSIAMLTSQKSAEYESIASRCRTSLDTIKTYYPLTSAQVTAVQVEKLMNQTKDYAKFVQQNNPALAQSAMAFTQNRISDALIDKLIRSLGIDGTHLNVLAHCERYGNDLHSRLQPNAIATFFGFNPNPQTTTNVRVEIGAIKQLIHLLLNQDEPSSLTKVQINALNIGRLSENMPSFKYNQPLQKRFQQLLELDEPSVAPSTN